VKVKCGTDIIEISRINSSINDLGERFINRIYTDKEIEYCESKNTQKYQHYAARFAAKEATYKAVSESLNDKYDLDWKDIEISNNKQGRPEVKLPQEILKNIESIDLSISHCREYACANVVILYK